MYITWIIMPLGDYFCFTQNLRRILYPETPGCHFLPHIFVVLSLLWRKWFFTLIMESHHLIVSILWPTCTNEKILKPICLFWTAFCQISHVNEISCTGWKLHCRIRKDAICSFIIPCSHYAFAGLLATNSFLCRKWMTRVIWSCMKVFLTNRELPPSHLPAMFRVAMICHGDLDDELLLCMFWIRCFNICF